MNNTLSPNTQTILLLTCELTPYKIQDIKPLTIAEWKRFTSWLIEKNLSPADLLTNNLQSLLTDWVDPKKSDNPITYERLSKLIGRGHQLALAMEKWQRAGIWVVTRSAEDSHIYPASLKRLLGKDSPPILFGCGNPQLLNLPNKRLAVVGSRNAPKDDLAYAYQIGKQGAENDVIIVSGGAKGIDETAMLGAIENGGKVIGIIADNLLQHLGSLKWRQGLISKNLVLISPFNPEANFNKFNAMARNDYIYCQATSSLVVHTNPKGGTFSGAEKNLKKGWIPLWFKPSLDSSINSLLTSLGGQIYQGDWTHLFDIVVKNNQLGFEDLFSKTDESMVKFSFVKELPKNKIILNTQFYGLFLSYLENKSLTYLKLTEIEQETGLHKTQLKLWLELAVQEKRVEYKPRKGYRILN